MDKIHLPQHQWCLKKTNTSTVYKKTIWLIGSYSSVDYIIYKYNMGCEMRKFPMSYRLVSQTFLCNIGSRWWLVSDPKQSPVGNSLFLDDWSVEFCDKWFFFYMFCYHFLQTREIAGYILFLFKTLITIFLESILYLSHCTLFYKDVFLLHSVMSVLPVISVIDVCSGLYIEDAFTVI